MTNHRLSYLRAISTIAIVFLHTAFATVLTFRERASESELILANTINNIVMWAVPCFVMVTGSLLLDKSRAISYKKLFKGYVLRIVVVLISFSFIYRAFDVLMLQRSFDINEVKVTFYKIFTATGWSHLWYLYMLISLYLMLPLFKKFVEASDKKDILYFLVLNLVFLSFIPLLRYWGINLGFYIQITTIYTFYLIAGYSIYNGIIKISKSISLVILIFALGASAFVTYLKWNNADGNIDMLNNYFSIVIVLQAIAMFNIIVNGKSKLPKILDKVLLSIDKHSLGIYLIHMIFVRYIFKYTEFDPFSNLAVSFLLVIGIVAISYIIAFMLKKLPFVKKYI